LKEKFISVRDWAFIGFALVIFAIPMLLVAIALPFAILSPWDPEPSQQTLLTGIAVISVFFAYYLAVAGTARLYSRPDGNNHSVNLGNYSDPAEGNGYQVVLINRSHLAGAFTVAAVTTIILAVAEHKEVPLGWISFGISVTSNLIIFFGIRRQNKRLAVSEARGDNWGITRRTDPVD
jgi:hypothetical protein